jgi:hypothetical protein
MAPLLSISVLPVIGMMVSKVSSVFAIDKRPLAPFRRRTQNTISNDAINYFSTITIPALYYDHTITLPLLYSSTLTMVGQLRRYCIQSTQRICLFSHVIHCRHFYLSLSYRHSLFAALWLVHMYIHILCDSLLQHKEGNVLT